MEIDCQGEGENGGSDSVHERSRAKLLIALRTTQLMFVEHIIPRTVQKARDQKIMQALQRRGLVFVPLDL